MTKKENCDALYGTYKSNNERTEENKEQEESEEKYKEQEIKEEIIIESNNNNINIPQEKESKEKKEIKKEENSSQSENYNELYSNYQDLLKEKDKISKTLNEEVLINEKQRDEILKLKNELNSFLQTQEAKDLKIDISEMIVKIPKLKNEINSYQNKLTSIEHSIYNIKKPKEETDNLNDLNNKSLSQKNELNELKKEYNSLNEKLQLKEKEIQSLLEDNKSLKDIATQNDKEKKCIQLNEEIIKLKKENEIINQEKEELKKSLSQMTNYQFQFANLTNELTSLKNEYNLLQTTLIEREKALAIAKEQINNPGIHPSSHLYQPILSIRSCLNASSMLLNNAHKFYIKESFDTFIDSVNYLRRELEICLISLSQATSNEVALLNLKAQLSNCLNEVDSYRNDNKKLYDLNIQLNEKNEFLRKLKDFGIDVINRIVNYYVYDNDAKSLIRKFVEGNLRWMYKENDLQCNENKIRQIKTKISVLKGNYIGYKYDLVELDRLETERCFIIEEIDKIHKMNEENEINLNKYDAKITESFKKSSEK